MLSPPHRKFPHKLFGPIVLAAMLNSSRGKPIAEIAAIQSFQPSRSRQIPIAPAAPPQRHPPRFRALALLGRRLPRKRMGHHPGVRETCTESDLSRFSKTLIVGFLPGFRSTKSGLLAACPAGYAALSAAATLAPTTRALNSSTVITSAVENASIVNVARWTSAADSAP